MTPVILSGNNNVVIATSNPRIKERLLLLRSYITSIKTHRNCKSKEELEDYFRLIKEISSYTMYTNVSFHNNNTYNTLSIDGFLFDETPEKITDKVLETVSSSINVSPNEYFDGIRGIKTFINVCNWFSFMNFIFHSRIKGCKIKDIYTEDALNYYRKTDNGCLDSFYITNITFKTFRKAYNY